MMKVRKNTEKGFTLIELGIVVAILSILSTTVLAGKGFLRAMQLSTVVQEVGALRKAVDVYIARRGGTYPELPGNLYLEGGMG
tara:strand:- start:241 stop:489 length:249 start_codon:yes stop_codon:yes gene_type:complete